MKVSKLILYGLGGVIAGLILENKSIRLKGNVAKKKFQLKDKLNKISR